jgi:hypothetical protein
MPLYPGDPPLFVSEVVTVRRAKADRGLAVSIGSGNAWEGTIGIGTKRRPFTRKSSPFTQIPFVAGSSQNRKIGDAESAVRYAGSRNVPLVAEAESGTSFFPRKEHADALLRNVTPPSPGESPTEIG